MDPKTPGEPPLDKQSSSDPEIDKAITDIQRAESDTELDAAFAPVVASEKRSLKQKYLDNKKWTIPVTVLLVLLIAVFVLPSTRYKILGVVIKSPVTISFTDATTHNPVTDAKVTLGNDIATTNASGKVVFTGVKPGNYQITVTKQYYKTLTKAVFVGLSKPPAQTQMLQATGRQVSVSVANVITGKTISGANISILGTSAKTDNTGVAHLVVPADKVSATAQITANDYNNSSVTVQILAKTTTVNSFKLVPVGRVYFLSNRSGKVDVVSTNYDGSDRQTLVAGTGYEDVSNTTLVPSPDQKYVALLTKRISSGTGFGLYIVNTATGKLAKAEEGPDIFIGSVGWSGSYFVYTFTNTTLNPWQSGRVAIKSYNAQASSGTTLDQTQATGDQSTYNLQSFSNVVTIIDGNVLYGTYWSAVYGSTIPDSDTDTINSIQPNGSGKKSLKTLTIPTGATYVAVSQVLQTPEVSYFEMPTSADGSDSSAIYFKYFKGSLTQTNSFTSANFNDQNIANGFVSLSPSGSSSLFADAVDGHLVVSTGDASAANKQKVIQLSTNGYIVGWLSDDYVLVTQNTNQLYVVPANASGAAKPLLVSDFLVPPQPGHS